MHRYDNVELADHHRPPEQRRGPVLDAGSQQALAARNPSALGAQRMSALQRAAGNAGVAGLVEDQAGDDVRSVLSSGRGQPLDRETRAEMEDGLRADFSSVRVHTDGAASRSAEAVAAKAYTVGDDIVFRDGHYDPSSDSGKRTIAHELTHVVQQREGPVDGTSTGDGLKVSDPGDRFEQEAEASADAVMSRQHSDAHPVSAPGLQREEMPEEDEAQMQRVGMEEEEEAQMQREDMAEEEEMAQS